MLRLKNGEKIMTNDKNTGEAQKICTKDFQLIANLLVIYIIGFEFAGKEIGRIAANINGINLDYAVLIYFCSGAVFAILNFFGFIILKIFLKVRGNIRKEVGKNIFLYLIIFPAVLYMLYVIIKYANNNWWLWVSGVVIALNAAAGIGKVLVMKSNIVKKKRVENNYLYKYIDELNEETGYQLEGIFTIENMFHNDEVNGTIIGNGRKRKMVISEKTLNTLSINEIGAVYAHECGHLKRSHKIIMFLFYSLTTTLVFYLISKIVNLNGDMYLGIFKILFFTIILNIIAAIVHKILLFTQEYSADKFAVNMIQDYRVVMSALKKTTKGKRVKKGMCFTDYLQASHPSEGMRMLKIKRYAERQEDKFE